jgi:hypothetical protein
VVSGWWLAAKQKSKKSKQKEIEKQEDPWLEP